MYQTSTLWLILGWVLFGGVVGLLARALFPGRQPMGWVATIALGIAGSFIGGAGGNFLVGGGQLFVMQAAGWIGSVIGALVALGVFSLVSDRPVRI